MRVTLTAGRCNPLTLAAGSRHYDKVEYRSSIAAVSQASKWERAGSHSGAATSISPPGVRSRVCSSSYMLRSPLILPSCARVFPSKGKGSPGHYRLCEWYLHSVRLKVQYTAALAAHMHGGAKR